MSKKYRQWLRRSRLASCSPCAGVNVGVPFKVGPVCVDRSIGVGGYL